MFFLILVALLIIVGLLWVFIRYEPKFDLIATGNTYTLLFWYNKWNWDNVRTRTYIVIF